MSKYMISIGKDRSSEAGTIHDTETKLKVKAFDLMRSKFKPRKGEVRYFVTSGDTKLAFETQGYKKQRKLEVLTMVAQYCVYLGLIEAQIHANLSGIL